MIGIEILAKAIKNNACIKGIKVGEKEIKVSLYADDTTAFVLNLDSVGHPQWAQRDTKSLKFAIYFVQHLSAALASDF